MEPGVSVSPSGTERWSRLDHDSHGKFLEAGHLFGKLLEIQRRASDVPRKHAERHVLDKEGIGEWNIRLYEEWGKPEKAAEWPQKLQANNASGR